MANDLEGKKVYIVSVEREYLVVASNEKDARRLGKDAMSDDYLCDDDFEVNPFVTYLPDGYENNSYVNSDVGRDISVEEALKLPNGYLNEKDPNAQIVRQRMSQSKELTERAKARLEQLKANPVPDDDQI